MAFADDIVLMARTHAGTRQNAKILLEELEKRSFRANARNSATLNITVRRKKWVSDSGPFLEADREKVPAIGPSQTYKYLGVPVGPVIGSSNPLL